MVAAVTGLAWYVFREPVSFRSLGPNPFPQLRHVDLMISGRSFRLYRQMFFRAPLARAPEGFCSLEVEASSTFQGK